MKISIHREANKRYYEKNKEKINKRAREWSKAHPERAKSILKKYRTENIHQRILTRTKRKCINSGIEFDLSLEDIVIPMICPYLKTALKVIGHVDDAPSLDRIDPKKGYIKGNVQVISFKANRMKNTASPEELRIFAASVLEL